MEADTEIVRLPSSIGMGRCIECGTVCKAGWIDLHQIGVGTDDGMCTECALKEFESPTLSPDKE